MGSSRTEPKHELSNCTLNAMLEFSTFVLNVLMGNMSDADCCSRIVCLKEAEKRSERDRKVESVWVC